MFSEIFSFGKDYPISHLVTFISGENVIIFHILVELDVLFVVYETIPKKTTTKKQKTKKKTPKIEFIIIIMKAAYCKSNA